MLLLNVIHFSYTVHYNVVMPNAFAEFKVTDFSVLFEFIQTKQFRIFSYLSVISHNRIIAINQNFNSLPFFSISNLFRQNRI